MAAITFLIQFSLPTQTEYWAAEEIETIFSLTESTLGSLSISLAYPDGIPRLVWAEQAASFALPIYPLDKDVSYIAYLSIDYATNVLTLSFATDTDSTPTTITATSSGANLSYTQYLRVFPPSNTYTFYLHNLIVRPFTQSFDDIIKLL